MAKVLSTEQRKVLGVIERVAKQRGASPMEIKAAVATGLVESNLTNIQGGDRDSSGWRQERAGLYKDPNNLEASVGRFFDETRAVKHKYKTAGELAAAVQRPAAQFRGRYQERSAEADALLGGRRGAQAGPAASPLAARATGLAATPDGLTRNDLLQQYVLTRGKPGALQGLAGGLGSLERPVAPAPQAAAIAAPTGSSTAGAPRAGSGKLLELFWQGPGGVNVKNGAVVPQGFVSGHDKHVHAAASPREVLRLAELAKEMGLHVGEHKKFGGVAPVHVKNSNHYRDQAIDVSGDPKRLAAYARRVAKLYGAR